MNYKAATGLPTVCDSAPDDIFQEFQNLPTYGSETVLNPSGFIICRLGQR